MITARAGMKPARCSKSVTALRLFTVWAAQYMASWWNLKPECAAIVLGLERDSVGVVLLGSETGLHEGSQVRRTGRAADVPVGDAMLGRTVNALGEPIDGLGPIACTETRPIEREAPGVVTREPVNQPLQTGILAIDAMVPIGRGQRELIIGDRQTGKTSIAVDAILNQKGQNVICIYVAIGQKASTVAKLRGTLEKHGALEYSIILSATAADSAPQQYIAPYAGAAIGEYFMEKGRDVLIVYDDLTKHGGRLSNPVAAAAPLAGS